MIKTNSLCKTYGNKEVVHNISLEVNKSEIFGFLGPNGAGKTTLMKMITNQVNSSSGNAFINGIDVTAYNELYYKIGIVFELPNLYMKKSIKQNLLLFAQIYSLHKSRVDEVIKLMQLSERQNDKVDKLSKGWKQRVLIARALLHSPDILILDEPTSGLDPNTTNLLHNIILDLNSKGVTVLITTHNMDEADLLCDRVAFIDAGEIKEIGNPTDLKIKYQDNEIEIKYYEKNNIKVEVLYNNFDTRKRVDELLESNKLISVKRKNFSLGEVFSKVTGGELS